MKLDMSNLAWENSGDGLVLLPSPGGDEEAEPDWSAVRDGGGGCSQSQEHFTKLLWE